MNRRRFLRTALCGAGVVALRANPRPPNIVLILADDLGYGDLGCYGSRIRTPNLDKLSRDGVRFNQFYSASPVCSPARAALLTGRYPVRFGVPRVLFPGDRAGIPDTETTIAQMLKTQGYRTMCAGKWHIGAMPEFMPNSRGFDEFFGLPYSHDMWPLPLTRNGEVVEAPARLDTLTERFTAEAVRFIQDSKDQPFFLYLSHTAPHIPLVPSARFRKRSKSGRYGDVVQEMDTSVGDVLQALTDNGLAENTLVIFTSDNGPWYQGSGGFLRGRKGETFEGGMRVPFLARLPGRIPEKRSVEAFASTLDLLPTLASLAGCSLPEKVLDGRDILPLLTGEAESIDRDLLLYFDDLNLQCARMGNWKLHVARYNGIAWTPPPAGGRWNLPLRPELYDLENDPEESWDVSEENPEIVAQIRARIEEMLLTFPDPVRAAWRDTMAIPVEWTESGALPVRKTSP